MLRRTIKRLFLALPLLVGLVIGAPSANSEQFLSGAIGDDFVAHAVDIANNLLPQGRLRDGTPPAPITPEERQQGVIPLNDARRIVSSAADTALTQHCGLDWRNLSFHPLMQRERARHDWTDRQLAYIGILHGYVQGTYRELLKTHQNCSTGHKRAIIEFFANKNS